MSCAALPRLVLDRGVSHEASVLRSAMAFFTGDGSSVTVDEPLRRTKAELAEVVHDASVPDWDGYGGSPISQVAVSHAASFLEMLPSYLPQPEVTPHPDGEIGFDWAPAADRLLAASIDATGRLNFAAAIGLTRLHGSEHLLDELPESFALALRRLFS